MTLVKICGITNLEDALAAQSSGADMLGFNFYKPSPRYVAPGTARDILSKLDKERRIIAFGVFVNESLDNLLNTAVASSIDVIQLHGDESPDFFEQTQRHSSLPSVKAFKVSPELSLDNLAPFCGAPSDSSFDRNGILLDANAPGLYGGSGMIADWEFARTVAQKFPRVYLAGGLNADNVVEAIRVVRPHAVDVASGVESSPGIKDHKKMEAFIANAKSA